MGDAAARLARYRQRKAQQQQQQQQQQQSQPQQPPQAQLQLPQQQQQQQQRQARVPPPRSPPTVPLQQISADHLRSSAAVLSSGSASGGVEGRQAPPPQLVNPQPQTQTPTLQRQRSLQRGTSNLFPPSPQRPFGGPTTQQQHPQQPPPQQLQSDVAGQSSAGENGSSPRARAHASPVAFDPDGMIEPVESEERDEGLVRGGGRAAAPGAGAPGAAMGTTTGMQDWQNGDVQRLLQENTRLSQELQRSRQQARVLQQKLGSPHGSAGPVDGGGDVGLGIGNGTLGEDVQKEVRSYIELLTHDLEAIAQRSLGQFLQSCRTGFAPSTQSPTHEAPDTTPPLGRNGSGLGSSATTVPMTVGSPSSSPSSLSTLSSGGVSSAGMKQGSRAVRQQRQVVFSTPSPRQPSPHRSPHRSPTRRLNGWS